MEIRLLLRVQLVVEELRHQSPSSSETDPIWRIHTTPPHNNEWMTHADIDGDGLAFFEGQIEGGYSRLFTHLLALLQEFEVILKVGMNKNCIR